MDGKVRRLQQSGLGRDYSRSQLWTLARLADLVDLPEGATLITAGEPVRWCYLLLDGSAVSAAQVSVTRSSGGATFVGLAETLTGGYAEGETVTVRPTSALVFTAPALRGGLDLLRPLLWSAMGDLAETCVALSRPTYGVGAVPVPG